MDEDSEILKSTKIHWLNTIFLISTPILALSLSIWHGIVFGISFVEISIFIFWYLATGLSITVGYHRLFSHRSHEAVWPVRLAYALFGAGAFQNSILEWSSDHRRHHKQTDTDEDPYNARRGFWWSHILWVMVDDDVAGPNYSNVKDLQKDSVVMFQHKHIFLIGFLFGMVLPAAVGYSIGGLSTGIGGFIWGGLIRTVLVHHGTFMINSAAHFWGKQNFGTSDSSKDSYWLAFFTFGEGFHNFHHTFQTDYRNGIRWWHWDPSKWLIWCGSKLRLNSNLKTTPEWTIGVARMRTKFKKRITSMAWGIDVQTRYEEILEQICANFKAKQRTLSLLKEQMLEERNVLRKSVKSQMADLKNSLTEIEQQFNNLLAEMAKNSPVV